MKNFVRFKRLYARFFNQIIACLFLIILVIPIGLSYNMQGPKSDDDSWEYVFIWQDEISLLGMMLYAISWITYTVYPKKLFKLGLVLSSLIIFFMTMLSLSLLYQDFIPGFGMLIPLIISFLILYHFARNMDVVEKLEKFEKN